ncbi:3-oxoacyl-[acyl-carrier-protein] reductase [Pigmentiphaga soli]|uniref:3-oxoacyl-[acyl-carrier-protein] reductase n=1 Tax=Pigmentiphaga soli TaxID=1007095 RepID=A0ABP8GGB9_9BURK
MGGSLYGRVAIVTGGSRGLGRVMAETLLDAGCRVLITAHHEPQALDEAGHWAGAHAAAGRLATLRADVTSPEDCAATIACAVERFGRIDVLVNNAGVGMGQVDPGAHNRHGTFWHTPAEAWRKMVDTNLNGPFYMARAAVPHMIERGFGRIVNISTSLPTMIRAGYSPYGPTKAGLEIATAIWARELAGTGVTCNALLPGGATDTRMIPGEGRGRATYDGAPLLAPDIMRAPVRWLASERSSAWTGRRFIAKLWDPALPDDEAVLKSAMPAQDVPATI